MRSALIGILVLSGLALVAGCNQTNGGTDGGDGPDAGTLPVDSGTGDPDAGMVCANTIPTSGFGATVGRKFPDFTLPDCHGNPYHFYNQDYCSNQITVLLIAAGWCHPCNLETDQIASMLIGPYGHRGVRVIDVLTQDDNFHVPTTPGFCDSWLSRTNPSSLAYQSRAEAATHALNPDDHITLLDADGVTQIYNPANSIPATVIIDGDGVIQLRFNGTNTDPASGDAALTDMTTCLDKLLATPRQLCH